MVALGVCELCRCWTMGLGIGPICRRWRGCAEVAKSTSSQASGHYGKTKRTPLSENSARLFRRVLLSSDVKFICVDLLVFHQLAWKMIIFQSNPESSVIVVSTLRKPADPNDLIRLQSHPTKRTNMSSFSWRWRAMRHMIEVSWALYILAP